MDLRTPLIFCPIIWGGKREVKSFKLSCVFQQRLGQRPPYPLVAGQNRVRTHLRASSYRKPHGKSLQIPLQRGAKPLWGRYVPASGFPSDNVRAINWGLHPFQDNYCLWSRSEFKLSTNARRLSWRAGSWSACIWWQGGNSQCHLG